MDGADVRDDVVSYEVFHDDPGEYGLFGNVKSVVSE